MELEIIWVRIEESLYTNSSDPSTEIDASKLMNPEKGTEIADCWKEFHLMIIAILKKAPSKKYLWKPNTRRIPAGKKSKIDIRNLLYFPTVVFKVFVFALFP